MISIIIPVFNAHEMTQECIEAVRENTKDYEIILVDNGSDPAIEGATIRNDENKGFPVAVNQGIRASRGEVICLLNNDTIVTPSWADKLISHLDIYAIVGPKTNYAAGIQMMTIPVYHDKAELYEVATAWAKERVGRITPVNWITGFCFIFRKQLYDEISPFDESLWPCSGEELDFCQRARAKGYQIGVIHDVYVHHEGSKTFKAMDVDYVEICKRNDKHLTEKWGNFWLNQLIPPENELNNGLRLNLGCGRFKLNGGFINIDQLERVKPDLVCDVLNLPYEPGTVDEIYAGHLLEHFAFVDGLKALQYWHFLLKEGGVIRITVPDFDYLVRTYISNPKADKLKEFNDLYIYSCAQESPHRYMYNEQLLTKVMEDTGFVDLKRMPVDHPYFPIPVEWQVGYEGRKRSIHES